MVNSEPLRVPVAEGVTVAMAMLVLLVMAVASA
jgi:hypothetical protein